MHPKEGKQYRAAYDTGHARSEGIDVVEQAHGAADLSGVSNEMRDQNRKCRTHQQCRNDDEQQVGGGHCGKWPVHDQRPNLLENA